MEEQSPKVLIADDDVDFRDMLRAFLTEEGYVTLEASNGNEAFEVAVNESPDVVILDVMMPARNGFDVCRELKNDQRTQNSVIVMLTVRNSLSDKLAGYVAGAQRYITKPCGLNEIKECVQSALRQQKLTRFQYEREIM